MARSAKPRKQYRPKPVGRPVMEQIRRDLILPCRMCIETLRASDDAEALDSARHTIAACLNSFYVAAEGRDRQAAADGLDALRGLIARHERTGLYRCTGPELNALKCAVNWADETLPYLTTAQLAAAFVYVHEVAAI